MEGYIRVQAEKPRVSEEESIEGYQGKKKKEKERVDAQRLRGVFHSLAHSVQRCGSRTRGESCKLAGQQEENVR